MSHVSDVATRAVVEGHFRGEVFGEPLIRLVALSRAFLVIAIGLGDRDRASLIDSKGYGWRVVPRNA
jgi:hypothetical protein